MISPVVRLRTTPSRPLAQKTQPIAQPTCVLMQMVRRRSVCRSKTHSMRSSIGQVQQQFLRAILGLLVNGHASGPNHKLGGQLLAQRLGQVRHFLERAGPFLEQPVADLRGPIRGLPLLGHPGLQLVGSQVEQMSHD